MVILESNCRWPTWLEEPTQALVAQRPGESPVAFESRAARFIRQAPAPLTATLVTSPATSPDHLTLRQAVVRTLLSMMRANGRGHLVLVADGDHAACRSLAWLAETLQRELGADSGVSLRLRTLPPPADALRRVA
jgi:hypothetical protein